MYGMSSVRFICGTQDIHKQLERKISDASNLARDLLGEGIYIIGFSYPVVPKGEARIRVQISAGHEREHLDKAVDAFVKVGRRHRVIA